MVYWPFSLFPPAILVDQMSNFALCFSISLFDFLFHDKIVLYNYHMHDVYDDLVCLARGFVPRLKMQATVMSEINPAS